MKNLLKHKKLYIHICVVLNTYIWVRPDLSVTRKLPLSTSWHLKPSQALGDAFLATLFWRLPLTLVAAILNGCFRQIKRNNNTNKQQQKHLFENQLLTKPNWRCRPGVAQAALGRRWDSHWITLARRRLMQTNKQNNKSKETNKWYFVASCRRESLWTLPATTALV